MTKIYVCKIRKMFRPSYHYWELNDNRANNVDLDEAAHNELSLLDLHCLQIQLFSVFALSVLNTISYATHLTDTISHSQVSGKRLRVFVGGASGPEPSSSCTTCGESTILNTLGPDWPVNSGGPRFPTPIPDG